MIADDRAYPAPAQSGPDDESLVLELDLLGQPLDLAATLGSGQAFRWQRDGNTWQGVAGHRVWRLRVDGPALIARAWPATDAGCARCFLERYLALDLDWRAVAGRVAAAHPAAAKAVSRFPGLRVIRQDAEETLLSFCAATASNVPRIARNVRLMSRLFGGPLAVVGGARHHDFPVARALAGAPRGVLASDCNLAYRADHVQRVAAEVDRRGADWLAHLRAAPYAEARAELDSLPHIGPKLADCICLIGLGHWEAVPVDTHIWAISRDLFGDAIRTRTLTAATYRVIGERWREVFGDLAGVAQQWLFHARRVDHGRAAPS